MQISWQPPDVTTQSPRNDSKRLETAISISFLFLLVFFFSWDLDSFFSNWNGIEMMWYFDWIFVLFAEDCLLRRRRRRRNRRRRTQRTLPTDWIIQLFIMVFWVGQLFDMQIGPYGVRWLGSSMLIYSANGRRWIMRFHARWLPSNRMMKHELCWRHCRLHFGVEMVSIRCADPSIFLILWAGGSVVVIGFEGKWRKMAEDGARHPLGLLRFNFIDWHLFLALGFRFECVCVCVCVCFWQGWWLIECWISCFFCVVGLSGGNWSGMKSTWWPFWLMEWTFCCKTRRCDIFIDWFVAPQCRPHFLQQSSFSGFPLFSFIFPRFFHRRRRRVVFFRVRFVAFARSTPCWICCDTKEATWPRFKENGNRALFIWWNMAPSTSKWHPTRVPDFLNKVHFSDWRINHRLLRMEAKKTRRRRPHWFHPSQNRTAKKFIPLLLSFPFLFLFLFFSFSFPFLFLFFLLFFSLPFLLLICIFALGHRFGNAGNAIPGIG